MSMNILKIKHSLVTKLDKDFLNLYEEYYIKGKNPKNRYFVLKKFKKDGLTFLSNVISRLSKLEVKCDYAIMHDYQIKGLSIFETQQHYAVWVNSQIMEIYYDKKYDNINGDERKYFLETVLKEFNETLGYEFNGILEFNEPSQSVTEVIF